MHIFHITHSFKNILTLYTFFLILHIFNDDLYVMYIFIYTFLALQKFASFLDKKNNKFDFDAKTDEKYALIIYGCMRFIDSANFMGEKLETLVRTLRDEDFSVTRKVLETAAICLTNNASCLRNIKKISDLKKEITNFKKNHYLSSQMKPQLKESTKRIIRDFIPKTGQEVTKFFILTR